MSDLHLEFHADGGKEFISTLDNDCDVLVLAGDISNADGINNALRLFARRFDNSSVVFVAGNHELYGSSPDAVERAFEFVTEENVHILEMGTVRIGSLGLDGHRFLGCSLWFKYPMRGDKTCMNDFLQIRDYEPWVYERNAASVKWLAENVQPGDVVVTHYLPAHESVHPKYAGSPLNDFFVCDVSDIINRQRPALWIHGHTHMSRDYRLGETRVVCNPFGYHGHEVNDEFDPDMTVNV